MHALAINRKHNYSCNQMETQLSPDITKLRQIEEEI